MCNLELSRAYISCYSTVKALFFLYKNILDINKSDVLVDTMKRKTKSKAILLW